MKKKKYFSELPLLIPRLKWSMESAGVFDLTETDEDEYVPLAANFDQPLQELLQEPQQVH